MSSQTTSDPALRVERREGGEAGHISLVGRLTMEAASGLPAALRKAVEGDKACRIDLSQIEAADAGGVALLLDAVETLVRQGIAADLAGEHGATKQLLDLLRSRRVEPPKAMRKRKIGLLDEIGRQTAHLAADAGHVLAYVGDVVASAGAGILRPRSIRWADLGRLTERTGADGLAIVVVITALMGLILGFQASIQLKQFGANIYAADLVGLSVTRELGPLMVAIVVAGRSGSSFAAEIGTMRVSEEVDALRTLGIDPYRFLVFPRVMALMIALPLLTILGDACALLGGLVIGVTTLDIPPQAYVARTQEALQLWDVFSGVLKSAFFALAIGLIACLRGLETAGGAEGVGRSTTSSVVTALFWLVALDFAFTILFHMFGK